MADIEHSGPYEIVVCSRCRWQWSGGMTCANCEAAEADLVLQVVPAAALRGAVEALQSLRAAWDQHMATCPQHAKVPTFEEIDAWMNAPSNTAEGGR